MIIQSVILAPLLQAILDTKYVKDLEQHVQGYFSFLFLKLNQS